VDEKKLIVKAQEGHRMSLNILLSEHYNMLFSFMLKLTCNEEQAKDLTQETMMKAVIHISQFRGKSKFSSWLIQIGINLYKNHARKHKVDQLPENREIEYIDQVEERVALRHELERVRKYLTGVKVIDRTIFVMKFYEGYNYEEISGMTGVKKGTCKSKVHYLIKKMKEDLEVEL
jgi:RNA polymerase sigma-70 factor (ECF subfamily)